jgi:hypothetical protein
MHWAGGSTSPASPRGWRPGRLEERDAVRHRGSMPQGQDRPDFVPRRLEFQDLAQVVARDFGEDWLDFHANQRAGDSSMRSAIQDRVMVLGNTPG